MEKYTIEINNQEPSAVVDAIMAQLHIELNTVNSITESIQKLPLMKQQVMVKVNELIAGLVAMGVDVTLIDPCPEDEIIPEEPIIVSQEEQ